MFAIFDDDTSYSLRGTYVFKSKQEAVKISKTNQQNYRSVVQEVKRSSSDVLRGELGK